MRPTSTEKLWRQKARTVEKLNADKEQTEPVSHSRKCCNVLILLTDLKGEVVTVGGLIDSEAPGNANIFFLNLLLKVNLTKSKWFYFTQGLFRFIFV